MNDILTFNNNSLKYNLAGYMSALASGFPDAELAYQVIPPKPKDLGEPFVGARYRQRRDICWISNRAFEEWVVISIRGDIVTLQPLTARYVKGTRRLSKQILRSQYHRCDLKACE